MVYGRGDQRGGGVVKRFGMQEMKEFAESHEDEKVRKLWKKLEQLARENNRLRLQNQRSQSQPIYSKNDGLNDWKH